MPKSAVIAFFAALAFCALALFAPGAQAAYSAAIEDLPVMPGMVEKTDQIVVFDTPEGRIAETTMETTLGSRQVLTYYHQALTPLGWAAANPYLKVYERKGEMLVIDIFQKPDGVTNVVQFKIAPIGKK